ncbi:uncharacterized protein AB675_2978 [Cyphellophora attinorum]|uniref:Uncharacterized protein n=1 Tax=Cyphellophora attinorum TaxID=1664694 RepID=A0A0N1GZA9_9EURO|nr:uncharacterized protein AB675_2978 [Phialophora attinorum]KPI36435.1 hypothetical protein AB675_2978 [Phialophora attinorum]
MNRNELAALLAATHSNKSPRTDPQHSSAAPLSPRQLFQSRVRNLGSHNDIVSPQSSAQYPERTSSLSPTKPTQRRSSRLRQAAVTRKPLPAKPSTAPDFVLEERAAWEGSKGQDYTQHNDDDFILIPASNDSSDSLDQQKLVPFARTSNDNAQIQRPKTSRGRPQTRDVEETKSGKTPVRPSKFLEGSMNTRSVGVSSTWDEHGDRLSLDLASEDSDATPRAARPSTDSLSSSDLSDFRPQCTTPATIRQRLSKFASSLKPVAEAEKTDVTDHKTPKRKGLRKSISTWSMHKLFGASGSDADSSDSAKVQQLDALNERKRKAEEAYEQQFGTKKQKSNGGGTVHDPHATIRGPQRTLKKKRSTSQTSTITPATKRRRGPATSTALPADPVEISEEDRTTDHRKRPSRRELEKENHQLRALLREQQAQSRANLQVAASRSMYHLPLEDKNPGQHRQAPATRKSTRSHMMADIPPVPPLPGRGALTNKTNTNTNVYSPPADTGTMKRIRAMPSPGRSQQEDTENNVPAGSRNSWNWPDDVF